MLKILDRYLVREILLPFFLGLAVLTFVLEIPVILREAESLIAKGVPWGIVARVLFLLLPSTLSITIPMALLLGILIGLGRLSADREFVALQACGVSLFRLLRPIALLATLATAATAYETIVALPNNNQTFRTIIFGVVADKLEKNVKPRVFFDDFPNRVIYVRDLPATGGWHDVFLADATSGDKTTVYFAEQGRIIVDRANKKVTLQLLNGKGHTTWLSKPDEYETTDFDMIEMRLDPEAVFPPPPTKGAPEMTIAELKVRAAEVRAQGFTPYVERFMIQLKFSLAFACPVLALIGLALGVSNRKDGKLASFVLGFGVIFVYYVLLYFSRALGYGGWMSPAVAPWIPNIVLGAGGIALAVWRAQSADQPIRISIPMFWQRRMAGAPAAPGSAARPARQQIVLVVRVPHLRIPRPSLLDLYVSRQYLRIFFFGIIGLLGIFYISTFMEHAEKLFRGAATTGLMLRFLYFSTPQFVYFVIPMSALLATLVTIGLMTKNSELIVMKACGVSLYRTAVPLLLFAAVWSAVLFGLQQEVLPHTNREARRLEYIIRGFPTKSFGLNRHWIIATDGGLYHYGSFDPQTNRFTQLSMYRVDSSAWRLDSLTYVKEVTLSRGQQADLFWRGRQGWTRDFVLTRRGATEHISVKYVPFAEKDLPLEPPSYFKTENLEPEWMTYGQLKRYVTQLRASGFNAVPDMVALQRKVSFPLVTLVMTLLAVPFAVTTGRRGALYGIGVGIVLAIVYWTTLSVFAAMGAGGLVPPTLAAWAPNILFGAAAAYMVLTVRT
jgi:LPS export ABC transporter permease LptF/LPS export ABC transporter permease LptG